MSDRRNFLATLGAITIAGAIPDWLFRQQMPIVLSPLQYGALPDAPVPVLWGDGVHDDTTALQALCDGAPVFWRDHVVAPDEDWLIAGARFRLSQPLIVNRAEQLGSQCRRGTIMGCQFT